MGDPEYEAILRVHLEQTGMRKALNYADWEEIQMSCLSAGAMKGRAQMSDLQYKIMSSEVNANVPPAVKHTHGGILPSLCLLYTSPSPRD